MRKYGTTVYVTRKWPLMLRLKGTVILQIWWQILLVGIYSTGVYLISRYTGWKMAYSLVSFPFAHIPIAPTTAAHPCPSQAIPSPSPSPSRISLEPLAPDTNRAHLCARSLPLCLSSVREIKYIFVFPFRTNQIECNRTWSLSSAWSSRCCWSSAPTQVRERESQT